MRLKKLQANLTRLNINNGYIYFSYETPIAFTKGDTVVISENIWSRTTGRHLSRVKEDNEIFVELSNEEFKEELNGVING